MNNDQQDAQPRIKKQTQRDLFPARPFLKSSRGSSPIPLPQQGSQTSQEVKGDWLLYQFGQVGQHCRISEPHCLAAVQQSTKSDIVEVVCDVHVEGISDVSRVGVRHAFASNFFGHAKFLNCTNVEPCCAGTKMRIGSTQFCYGVVPTDINPVKRNLTC
jgi:hypothetical protein